MDSRRPKCRVRRVHARTRLKPPHNRDSREIAPASEPLVTLWPALPATGLPILTPAGLPPAEHISLSWTHNPACDFHRTGLSRARHSPPSVTTGSVSRFSSPGIAGTFSCTELVFT